MIPIILLGEKDDSAVCDALYLQLNQNCAKVSEKDFCWNQHADFLLADSVQTNFLDAGGGLVILKESFCRQHAPKHLLHATCIFLSQYKMYMGDAEWRKSRTVPALKRSERMSRQSI